MKSKKELGKEIEKLNRELQEWKDTAEFEGMNGFDLRKENTWLRNRLELQTDFYRELMGIKSVRTIGELPF